jgi:hypothetical protein
MPNAENSTDKLFKALFDGDEVNGKTYGLGEVLTNLDAPTAAYLTSIGRIEEISEETAAALEPVKKPREKAEKPAKPETPEALVAKRIEAKEFDKDLVDDKGEPLENDALAAIAKAEGLDLKKTTKAEMLAEIMVARAAKA